MLGGIDQAVRAAKDGAASLKRVFYWTI